MDWDEDNPQRVYARVLSERRSQQAEKAARREQRKRRWRRERVAFVRAAAANAAGTVLGGVLLVLGAQALGYLGGFTRESWVAVVAAMVSVILSAATFRGARNSEDGTADIKLMNLELAARRHRDAHGQDPDVPEDLWRQGATEPGDVAE